MSANNLLEKRVKATLIQGQEEIPRYMTEVSDFINLVKNRDIYMDDLEPSEMAIMQAFYPKVLESTVPGIGLLEKKYVSPLSFIKILMLGLSGQYTTADIMKYIKKWITPYYTKNYVLPQAELDTMNIAMLNLVFTLKDFILRRRFMVHALSDSTVLDARLLHASSEAGPTAFLLQFIAWHLYHNYDRMRALVLMASLERHVALTISKNPHVAERLDKFLAFLQNIHSHKMLNGKPTSALAEKERLAKEAANALLRENDDEKAKISKKATRKQKKKNVKNIASTTSSLSPILAPVSPESSSGPSPTLSFVRGPLSELRSERNNLLAAEGSLLPIAPSAVVPTVPVSFIHDIPPPPTVPESATVERFWLSVNHRFIFNLLRRIQASVASMSDVRFYVKGSAAMSLYYQTIRGMTAKPHTSDYDCTMLVNPSLPKEAFYSVRSRVLDNIISECLHFVNGQSINPYLTETVLKLGIPFATARFNPRLGVTNYIEYPEIPTTVIDIDEKRMPLFYTDPANNYAYSKLKDTATPMLLNMRILRTLKEPKNVTLVSLYLKTNPEIKLVDIAVPFYVYPGPPVYKANAQMSLEDQWTNSSDNQTIQGISVLSLESLYKEQQRLLNLPMKNRSLVESRLAYINDMLMPNYVKH
jgi:hypothetical protein